MTPEEFTEKYVYPVYWVNPKTGKREVKHLASKFAIVNAWIQDEEGGDMRPMTEADWLEGEELHRRAIQEAVIEKLDPNEQ